MAQTVLICDVAIRSVTSVSWDPDKGEGTSLNKTFYL